MYLSYEAYNAEESRVNKLAHKIRLGKIWSAIEFLAEHAAGQSEAGPSTIEWLLQDFPNSVPLQRD
jgi:hypothetical protein